MLMAMKVDRKIDCIGLFCPVPVLKVREALDTMSEGEILEVLADDPAAEEDIPRLVSRIGHELIKKEKKEETLRFIIKKRK